MAADVHVAVVWIDLGDPDALRHVEVPCGADAASVSWTVNRDLVTCAACVEADPGPRRAWRPRWTPFGHARWRAARKALTSPLAVAR
ncbi:MAG TPA: hypothetical protein VF841_17260 [Anaeromyxobacter sp.]